MSQYILDVKEIVKIKLGKEGENTFLPFDLQKPKQ